MVGASELIQTLGAMIIFSLILLTSNRMIQMNMVREVETETERLAITIAQDMIAEAQTKAYDANTAAGDIPKNLPEGFSSIGPGSGETRATFNDFDDYDGYTTSLDTELGADSYQVLVEVAYVTPATNYDIDQGSKSIPTNYKKMRVTVTSDYLKNNNQQIQLSYLRQYYKTQNG